MLWTSAVVYGRINMLIIIIITRNSGLRTNEKNFRPFDGSFSRQQKTGTSSVAVGAVSAHSRKRKLDEQLCGRYVRNGIGLEENLPRSVFICQCQLSGVFETETGNGMEAWCFYQAIFRSFCQRAYFSLSLREYVVFSRELFVAYFADFFSFFLMAGVGVGGVGVFPSWDSPKTIYI